MYKTTFTAFAVFLAGYFVLSRALGSSESASLPSPETAAAKETR